MTWNLLPGNELSRFCRKRIYLIEVPKTSLYRLWNPKAHQFLFWETFEGRTQLRLFCYLPLFILQVRFLVSTFWLNWTTFFQKNLEGIKFQPALKNLINVSLLFETFLKFCNEFFLWMLHRLPQLQCLSQMQVFKQNYTNQVQNKPNPYQLILIFLMHFLSHCLLFSFHYMLH